MRSVLVLLFALVATTLAGFAHNAPAHHPLPHCATSCIGKAVAASKCHKFSHHCFCKSPSFLKTLKKCVKKGCSNDNVHHSAKSMTFFCKNAGVVIIWKPAGPQPTSPASPPSPDQPEPKEPWAPWEPPAPSPTSPPEKSPPEPTDPAEPWGPWEEPPSPVATTTTKTHTKHPKPTEWQPWEPPAPIHTVF